MADLLRERFPERAGDSAYVVVHVQDGVNSESVVAELEALRAQLSALPKVAAVSSPYEAPGQISPDGTTAIINVRYSESAADLDHAVLLKLRDLQEEATRPGFQVEAGGAIMRRIEMEPPGISEAIGVLAAVLILMLAFGSVVAMGLPIGTALIALTSGFFLVGVGSAFVDLPSFTPQFSAMIGIGVGIDYALLVVTRFRESQGTGASLEDSILTASRTAGRSVVLAGATVMIALLGLWAAGLPPIGWVGTASSLIVLLSVCSAILVLPALLRLAGKHIDRWRLPGFSAPSLSDETGLAYRWSRLVQRYPIPCVVLSLGILLAAAAPVLDLRLGSSDAGNNPESFTSRRAYDLLAEGFGPGFNGPIILAFRIEDGDAKLIEELPAALQQTPGVAAVSPPAFNEDRSAAVLTLIPATAPQDEETRQLVGRLRSDLRSRFQDTGVEPFTGGPTALFIDVGDRLASRMPYFFAGVIGLSFLLLMIVFRSIVVAVKAAIMNLLSIGASFGLLVAVFQWGWLGNVFGVHREGPIESFMPMMLFAVLFGLSMDYEVFLVSRIREEYLGGEDNTEAVARGLSVTSRVISAAAAIMIAVFLAFALSDQRVVKEFGMGLAVAIFVDATLVRMVLVPSLMQIMGRGNWWLPAWMERFIPHFGAETPSQAVRQPASINDIP
jgi:RND superfamily putative drug exporter